MPRVKRGTKRHAKRLKLLDRAKGHRMTKSKLYRAARESVQRALKYSFRDRRARKRDFRSLWIIRIGAATRKYELSYNRFIHGLKLAAIDLDRKILADIAVRDAAGFASLVDQSKQALAAKTLAAKKTA
ncbi:MAG: 50S ribosomal protein L20 [Acidobacteria bacterium RIFCSPLOWO2_12_FULL_54_10]|nr:MAG: 50S ribosomal protein L20 [Acidobacteria bacterium RIFCSPLOWO2_12_FULL_54_10]